MIILFPVGGKGKRFQEAGYNTHKPFLKLGDKRLIDWAIESYPIADYVNKHLFVVRPEYEHQFALGCKIAKNTNGPLETILTSDIVGDLKKYSGIDLLIPDCDSFIKKDEIMMCLAYWREKCFAGGVPVMTSDSEENSYAILNNRGEIIRCAEKEKISKWWTTGPYWFKDCATFLKYGFQALNDGVSSICPVFNYMIKDGLTVQTVEVKHFHHLGTPEAYKEYAKKKGLEYESP